LSGVSLRQVPKARQIQGGLRPALALGGCSYRKFARFKTRKKTNKQNSMKYLLFHLALQFNRQKL
jgi:hypothetical protein